MSHLALRSLVQTVGHFERVFLVTHPVSRVGGVPLQDEVARFLASDPRFRDTPRIVLRNSLYDVRPGSLLEKQASILLESSDGHLGDFRVSADEVHIAGGHLRYCLKRTITDVVDQFLSSDRTELRVVAHVSLIFGFNSTLQADFATFHSPFALMEWTANGIFGWDRSADDCLKPILGPYPSSCLPSFLTVCQGKVIRLQFE